jgi:trypsin
VNHIFKYSFKVQCGVPAITPSLIPDNRVLNGDDAVANSWPWMVNLIQWLGGNTYSGHFCGGSIISQQYILTAAHCVDFLSASQLAIYVGGYETVQSGSTLNEANIYRVSRIKRHPFYSSRTLRNDIALVKLSRSITYSDEVSPICLPATTDSKVVYNKKLVLSGWGVDETRDLPSVLQQAQLTVINGNSLCTANGRSYNINTNYCALGVGSPTPNSCFGDSGGPLQYYDGTKWTVFGLVSYGYVDITRFCINSVPSYYANVPYFLNWIKKNAI